MDCVNASVLPFSDAWALTVDDLRHLSAYALRLARHEIYARHGYRFKSQDLQDFFARRSWYEPVGPDVSLSDVELANVALLRQVEDGAVEVAPHVRRLPDGFEVPPLTAWQADVVHSDGRVEAGIADGFRGRVTDIESGRTVLIRVDQEDALHYDQDEQSGTVMSWDQFPPVLIEPFVQGYGIVPEPLGHDQVLGEPVTHVRLQSEGEYETLEGEAWVTDDGIFVRVDVHGVYTEDYRECCDDGGVPWRLDYQLENLVRGRPSQSVLEPPPFYEWAYARVIGWP
jgi:hypothetical protein